MALEPWNETWTQHQPGICKPTILLIQEHGLLNHQRQTIKVATMVSNLGSWWLPVTTSGVVDTVLSRPVFPCTLTQLSGSVHTDTSQTKVGPDCLSKFTTSPCANGFQIIFLGIKSVLMLPFCIFMLQTTPIWLHFWCQLEGCPMCQASRDRSAGFPVPGWGVLMGNGRDVNCPEKIVLLFCSWHLLPTTADYMHFEVCLA